MLEAAAGMRLAFLSFMRVNCTWKDRLSFVSNADGHDVAMDSKPPLGTDLAMTPKQLVLSGLCGCTAMDVVSLLKKHKQPLEGFEIEATAETTDQGHPVVFREIHLVFRLKGAIDPAKAIEAVTLSQTRYCGVSAMLSKAVPIHYTVELNGSPVASGQAAFAFTY